MRTIHSRTYTNVALTVLIILLALVLARPFLDAPSAYATSSFKKDKDEESTLANDAKYKVSSVDPTAGQAVALREVAAANREMAAALRDQAQAQREVAGAIAKLGASVTGK